MTEAQNNKRITLLEKKVEQLLEMVNKLQAQIDAKADRPMRWR